MSVIGMAISGNSFATASFPMPPPKGLLNILVDARGFLARGWCINVTKIQGQNGGVEYCALGAITAASDIQEPEAQAEYLCKFLPKDWVCPPQITGGYWGYDPSLRHRNIYPDQRGNVVIWAARLANFNNSTSKEAVLKLFDAAITRLRVDHLMSQVNALPPEETVKELS